MSAANKKALDNCMVAIFDHNPNDRYFHKKPRIYSVCRNYNPFLSSCMTYYRVYNKNNTTCATYVVGTAYPSGEPEFTRGF